MGRSNKLHQTVPPAPVDEYVAPAPAVYAAPPPVEKYIAPAPAVIAAPAPVEKYIVPAPAVYAAPVEKYIVPAPAVYAAPSPSVEYITPAPAVYAALAPVVEFSPVPAVIQAPTPAVEYITPVALRFSSANASGGVYCPRACGVSSARVPSLSGCIGHVFASRDRGGEFAVASQGGPLVREKLGGGAHSSSARYVQHACLLLVWLVVRPCGLRHLGHVSWWRHFVNWQREGRGRVRVARVLEKVLGRGWL